MLGAVLLAASVSAQVQVVPPESLARQASATVRIVAAVRITRDETPAEALVTPAEIRTSDGRSTPARLIEFP